MSDLTDAQRAAFKARFDAQRAAAGKAPHIIDEKVYRLLDGLLAGTDIDPDND